MKETLRQHGLSLALFGFFIVFQLGLSLVGQRQHNQQQIQHGQPVLSYLEYVTSAEYLEATMENWESEFLQMFAYVFMTAFLFQKGSAESKDPDEPEAVDRDPQQARNKKDAPWPVRRDGVVLKLYENSLSLALFLLFVISFICMQLAAQDSTASRKSPMAVRRLQFFSMWQPRSSGSSPCKTGKASFSRSQFSLC